MLTKRENYLIAAKGDKPEWVPSFTEDTNVFVTPAWARDENGFDKLGVKWVKDESGAGFMPDPRCVAMKDIADWKNIVHLDNPADWDWEKLASDFFNGPTYDPDKVNIAMANTGGLFLLPINMMGWVDGLCAIYDDPEAHAEFEEYLCDYLCKLIHYIGKYIHPDIIFSGDDVAAANGPLISLETWNECYKKLFARVADAIHETGALAEFHCCGNCDFLIEEFINCGYDICQLPVPNDALIADKKRFGNRLVITGGWERHGEAGLPGATEDVVRKSVHTAIDTFGADGALIFWDGGIIGESEESKQKLAWVMDELHKYGREVYA